MLKHPLPQEVIDSFHVMWDNYPEAASIVHKSKEVQAVNKAHFLKPGLICARMGIHGPHVGCLAHKALSTREPVVVTHHSNDEECEMVTYWIPLDGHPDYFIHVSTRFTIDYANQSFTWAPMKDESKVIMSFNQDTGENEFATPDQCGSCDACHEEL